MAYKPRVIDQEIRIKLAATGAVVLEGPKACGKTATARQHTASEVLLDVDRSARTAVSVAPELVLEGPAPRLIDEWQVEPEIWNHVRRAVDDRGKPGQFILTGSAVPPDDVTYAYGSQWTRTHQMTARGKDDGFTREDLLAVAKEFDVPRNGVDIVEEVEAALGLWVPEAKAVGLESDWITRIQGTFRHFA